MAHPSELIPRYVRNTALPYDTSGSVVDERLVYVDGENVLSSLNTYLERRPGFAAFTATTFGSEVVRRVFTWRRWAGNFFVMVNTLSGSQSIVYKREIGVDAGFVSLLVSSVVEPFDFCTGNNHVFFTQSIPSGSTKNKWDGTTLTLWGINDPKNPPTPTLQAGTLDSVFGYEYVFCFRNSTSGHISSPSPTSTRTAAATNMDVSVNGIRSTDAQVDEVAIYRTTDGGGGLFFEIDESPIANPGAGNWTVVDNTPDVDLKSNIAPLVGANNQVQAGTTGCSAYAGRIWTFNNNKVLFSGFEEVDDGVEEECFPPNNIFPFPGQVTGLGVVPSGLLIFTTDNIWKISGDSLDSFRRELLFSGYGTHERATITQVGRAVAWLDSGSTIRMTDGFTQQEIGFPIIVQIASITHTSASMAFHAGGRRNWLVLSDGTNLYVYDLDLEQWMPPWVIACRAVHSGNTAEGTKDLFLGFTSTSKVLNLTPSTYLDDGSSYSAFVKLNLFSLTEQQSPGWIGVLEYVAIERNAIALTDVQIAVDQDPGGAIFSSIFANEKDPPLRNASIADLIEKWYDSRDPTARRVSIRFDWATGSTNFRLYSFGLMSRQLQRLGRR